ncbi:uncharacterized protein K02A2.6-like [Drosophila ananassae]|uniref:uncharacterized protein K02A2.6-like n=1 Tax=Drosophila ananassae TaxID=7217 RepID=UPI001D000516|nr:uncharacterized protein K02A2.6-like [Drosophila ananassae]
MTRLMDKVIPASLRNEVFVYLDDLLVISDTFNKHLEVLETVAKRIQEANLTLNVEKSKFFTEQECLAALVSIKKFRAYVEGLEFTVITDHASLKWLMSQNDVNTRLARVEHEQIAAIDFKNGLLVDIDSQHFKSAEYMQLMEGIKSNLDNFPDLRIVDSLVYRRTEYSKGELLNDAYAWKLWIPKSMIQEVLKKSHDDPLASHGGVHKTLERRYYFWPGMVNDVKDYISACESCRMTKAPNRALRPPMGKAVESQRFFQRLNINFLGPYPRAVKKLTADVVLKYLEEDLFHTFGFPESIVSDNGSQFRSEKFQGMLRSHRITHTLTAVHAPQANASERVNRSVIAGIRAYIRSDQKDWDENLSKISCALRSATHSGLGSTTYYMVFGQQMITSGATYSLLRKLAMLEDKAATFSREDSLEVIRKKAAETLGKQHERNQRHYNLRAREVSYKVGQEVYRRNFKQSCFQAGYNAKLAPLFVKARVRRKIAGSIYELEDLNGKLVGRYHGKDIRQA